MPLESGRVQSRRRLFCPDDNTIFLDIPVIDEIEFVDQKSDAQAYRYRLTNTNKSTRTAHVHAVVNPDNAQTISVERVDQMRFRDQKSDAQETVFRFVNNDPPPAQPGGGGARHKKTHIVRYFKDNDTSSGVWADCEIIDEIEFEDAKSDGQALVFALKNAAAGAPVGDSTDPFSPTIGNVDLSLTLKSPGNGFDPPYRIDPFQNIVNISWNADRYLWSFLFVRGNLGGSITQNGSLTDYYFSAGGYVDPAENLAIAWVNVETATPSPPPPVPPVPDPSQFLGVLSGWHVSGVPGDQYIGNSTHGYAITSTTGGPYFVSVTTQEGVTGIPGNPCTLNYDGLVLTNGSYSGFTWTPASEVPLPPTIPGDYAAMYFAPSGPFGG